MRKFNLSLDDMSPHPRAGLNFESIEWCDKLIEKYPFLCINLFVPTSYCRLGEGQNDYHISKYRDWVNKLDALPKLNYRINFHGVNHSRQYYPSNQKRYAKYPKSNNDEWQYLNYKDAQDLVTMMLQDFKAMGLSHVKTFRPPGWKVSKDAVRALQDAKFGVIAGSPEYYKKVKDVLNIKWVSYNYDLVSKIPAGDIVAYGHTSDWTNNYLNEDKYNLICRILDSDNFSFHFIEDMHGDK